MRVFPHKQNPIGGIGPLALPIDRRKGPEGRLPRLSKAVKVTAMRNDNHPLKIHAKRGGFIPPMGFFAGCFLTKNI